MSDISNGRTPVNAAVTAAAAAKTWSDPRRWRALILLCAAQFMVVLDGSIVNVALPSGDEIVSADAEESLATTAA